MRITGITERLRTVRSGNNKLSAYIKPMLAQLYDRPFDDPNWIFEIKWDGYRAIAETGNKLKLYSRNGLSFLQLYPEVAKALEQIKEKVVLDGEIVVLNERNRPDFQKLQQYDYHRRLPIQYYIFDCLYYQGKSIMHLPLVERKRIARSVIPRSTILKYSDHVAGSGADFFAAAVSKDLEGIIAKRASSVYLPGKRTRDWLKIKNHNTQEAIIVGYTAPRRSRQYFGALILAIQEKGKFRYIGHTGTGFTQRILQEVYEKLQPLKRASSPFDHKIRMNSAVTWVEPVLVCNIKFTEITQDGILRHPVFLGLRMDKSAREVTTMDTTVKSAAGKAKNTTSSGKNKKSIRVNGHTLPLTNLDKVYFPQERITKGDVIQYYNNIYKFIIPYLKNRPQSLRRNPNGITEPGFFQKEAGVNIPEWIKTINLKAESVNKKINYIVCNDKATLLYMNNLGCIEINPWNSRIATLDRPDYMVIDIDPSEKHSFDQVIDVALVIHSILAQAGAPSYCKTSGASGLHVYVPLKALYTYEQIRSFAEVVSTLTTDQLPDTTTTERSLDKREGKIYVDYLQNKRGQTLASVYSLRPKPGGTVSTPLHWKEVRHGLHPSHFTINNLNARLEKEGDLFNGVLTKKIDLKKCLKNLNV